MKHIILFICLFFGIAGTTSAQTTKNTDKQTTKKSTKKTAKKTKKKGTTAKATNQKNANARKKPSPLNDRRIYHWKDGQRATPTGHDATGTGGGYSALKKDTLVPTAKDTTSAKKHNDN